MIASDVMVSPVITVKPSANVKDVARLLIENHISAVPVVNDEGLLAGIVSEGDIMRRAETGTERQRAGWLLLLAEKETLAFDYVRAHGRKVMDVMTRDVISASADTPLNEIASLMEKHSIKRIPIVEGGRPIGIVSRANFVQLLAGAGRELEIRPTDRQIRERLLARLSAERWAHTSTLNVTVTDGVVDLWGMTASDAERQAVRVAAEGIDGVREVNDNLFTRPPYMMGA